MNLELIDNLKEFAGYAAAVGTFLAGLYKDKILSALNIKKAKKEVDSTTSDLIEKNLLLYQKLLDDYTARKEAEDEKQIERISQLEQKVNRLTDERELLEKEKREKELEISKMVREIHEIKHMLNKALKQLDYYKQNSDLELPENLQ